MTFFETSYWLHKEYLKRNFLITCKGTEWKTYIEKREIEKLSKFGLIFFQKYFKNYKEKTKIEIKNANLTIAETLNRDITKFSDTELRKDFINKINFTNSLSKLYYFTEYFLHRKLHKEKWEEKIQEMQKIKFKLRTVLNKTIFKGNIFEKYLKEIQKRTRRNDLQFLHYQEIADLLVGKKIKKENRKNFVWGKFNNWKPITGKRALKIIRSFDKVISQEVKQKEFYGMPANPGMYKGYVKIIPVDLKRDLTGEISKMKKGEILVTGSTGPEMILACKKAGAIVTEEGRICSHAAIVSRELGIPCIIGTKIATQILKDGDLIEVNANKGIIKIL